LADRRAAAPRASAAASPEDINVRPGPHSSASDPDRTFGGIRTAACPVGIAVAGASAAPQEPRQAELEQDAAFCRAAEPVYAVVVASVVAGLCRRVVGHLDDDFLAVVASVTLGHPGAGLDSFDGAGGGSHPLLPEFGVFGHGDAPIGW